MKTSTLQIICGALIAVGFVGIGALTFSHLLREVAQRTEQPLEEFDIGEGPRPILVPVRVGSKVLLFCVDTGAWKTAFDISLSPDLGQPRGTTTVETSAGPFEATLFGCPDAFVGSICLGNLDTVIGCDLAAIRYASGQEVYG